MIMAVVVFPRRLSCTTPFPPSRFYFTAFTYTRDTTATLPSSIYLCNSFPVPLPYVLPPSISSNFSSLSGFLSLVLHSAVSCKLDLLTYNILHRLSFPLISSSTARLSPQQLGPLLHRISFPSIKALSHRR